MKLRIVKNDNDTVGYNVNIFCLKVTSDEFHTLESIFIKLVNISDKIYDSDYNRKKPITSSINFSGWGDVVDIYNGCFEIRFDELKHYKWFVETIQMHYPSLYEIMF